MPRVRESGAAFLVGLVFLLASPLCDAREFTSPTLHGIVKDSLGRAIEEVEVLVLGDSAGVAPLAVARTDDRGRFFVAGLAPGVYRVAAIKQGYLAFLGRFDTLLRNSMDLVLRPVPADDGSAPQMPADASWILRLPARSLLRETDAADLLRQEGSGGPRVAGSPIAEMIEGQFDHLVNLSGPLLRDARDASDAGGGETRMRLASSIGQVGSVRVSGQRESFNRVASAEGDAETASRAASSVLVEASCATGPDASLAMKASYTQGDVDISMAAPQSAGRLRHARQAWGYDANWSTQLDAASRLGVKVGYLDTLASFPGTVPAGPALSPGDDPRRSFTSRAMAAGGSYESLVSDRHQIRVDLEASHLDHPLPRSYAAAMPIAAGPATAARWNVRVRAEDQWLLSTPLTVVYGLGYVRGSDARALSVVEPRFGGIWTQGALRARVVVLYDMFADGGAAARYGWPMAGAARQDPALGYDAAVDTALPWGFTLKAAQSYEPVAFDAAGAVWERIDPGFTPLYATDGFVSATRGTLTLSHEAGGVNTYVQLLRGHAEGTLAQVFPFEVPLQFLADRRLRYQGGRVGVRVAGSGTDVFAEYRRVEDTTAADALAERTTQEFVELQVAQALLRGAPRGMSWRILLAARTSPQRTVGEADPASVAGLKTLTALNQRVSAGVSVAF